MIEKNEIKYEISKDITKNKDTSRANNGLSSNAPLFFCCTISFLTYLVIGIRTSGPPNVNDSHYSIDWTYHSRIRIMLSLLIIILGVVFNEGFKNSKKNKSNENESSLVNEKTSKTNITTIGKTKFI